MLPDNTRQNNIKYDMDIIKKDRTIIWTCHANANIEYWRWKRKGVIVFLMEISEL